MQQLISFLIWLALVTILFIGFLNNIGFLVFIAAVPLFLASLCGIEKVITFTLLKIGAYKFNSNK